MNEQNDHIWMHKKPETVFDWLAIIAISIALYLMLGHLNVFAGGIAKFLDVVAPFASGIVIAYVLDCIVRPVQRYVMKENPKLRWLSILIAYIVAALIITLLVSGAAGRFQHYHVVHQPAAVHIQCAEPAGYAAKPLWP